MKPNVLWCAGLPGPSNISTVNRGTHAFLICCVNIIPICHKKGIAGNHAGVTYKAWGTFLNLAFSSI